MNQTTTIRREDATPTTGARSACGPSADLDGSAGAAAGLVTAGTLAVAFGLLALGVPFFWVAFPVGFGGVLPLAVALARRRDAGTGSTRDARATGDAREDAATAATDTDAALSTLRDRYARGEIDDEAFEARLDRLLVTETVADARADVARRASVRDGDVGGDATRGRDADADR